MRGHCCSCLGSRRGVQEDDTNEAQGKDAQATAEQWWRRESENVVFATPMSSPKTVSMASDSGDGDTTVRGPDGDGQGDEDAPIEMGDDEEISSNPFGFVVRALKTLRTLSRGTDIVRVSLPIRVCTPASFLEVAAKRNAIMMKVVSSALSEATEERRFLAVLASRFAVLDPKGPPLKNKPFNPVIGETFAATYDIAGDKGSIVAEQVSHNPPVTAFHTKHDGSPLTFWQAPLFALRWIERKKMQHSLFFFFFLI